MSMTGAVVDIVSDLYCFRDRNEVSAYLALHREILPALVEAHSQIQAQFGSGTPVVLSVISEPANRQSAELFARRSTDFTRVGPRYSRAIRMRRSGKSTGVRRRGGSQRS